MSCTYKVSTRDKKSIVQTEIFIKTVDGVAYEARMENTWRWGHAVISDVEKDSIDPSGDLLVSDYCIEDQQYDDGVALWFYYSDNVPEEVREEFEQAWDEDGYSGIEENGWLSWDVETTFIGPLEVELIEEVEDEEDEDDDSIPNKQGTWPF